MSSGIDLIEKAGNVGQLTGNSNQDQYATGWWNRITGGKAEKASAIAMANVDRGYQTSEAEKNRAWQEREAQKNRDYQERLSNSAYQRQMEDLKKAGLNPAMLYTKMGGASSPSGSMGGGAQGSGSRSTPPMSSTGQLVQLVAAAVGASIYATKSASAKAFHESQRLTYKYFK